MLNTGSALPYFSLPDQDNETIQLSDFVGKWMVIFVYPKDDTPGCTIEGKGFNSAKPKFDELNTKILGLSQDDVPSHKNFCNKFNFSICLLSDSKAELLKNLGVPQQEYKGQKYWSRTTIIVDPQGVIRKVYENVKPEDHEKTVLNDLRALQRL